MDSFEALGFAFRPQYAEDYGIDAHAELIEAEHPIGRLLGIQLKSGPSYFTERQGDSYVFRADRSHVEYWTDHCLPVLVCLCDVDNRQIYWQVVNRQTAISTGKGYKFLIPMSQHVDSDSAPTFADLLTPVVSASSYTIFEESDVSHAGAKRYSIKAVVNSTVNKTEVASIVRQLTNDGAERIYHRDHLSQGRWGDSEAKVVWTFVYASANDYATGNPICRSLWVDPDLPEQQRLLALSGENIGDHIYVAWNSMYLELARHVATNTSTKSEYLGKIVPLLYEISALLKVMEEQIAALSDNIVSEEAFLSRTEKQRTRINQIEEERSDMPLAPYECNDVDEVFRKLVANLGNIALFYSESGRQTWASANQRAFLAIQQLAPAQESLKSGGVRNRQGPVGESASWGVNRCVLLVSLSDVPGITCGQPKACSNIMARASRQFVPLRVDQHSRYCGAATSTTHTETRQPWGSRFECPNVK